MKTKAKCPSRNIVAGCKFQTSEEFLWMVWIILLAVPWRVNATTRQRCWKRGTRYFMGNWKVVTMSDIGYWTFAAYFDPTWEPLFALSTIAQIGHKEVRPGTSVHGFETFADPGQELVVEFWRSFSGATLNLCRGYILSQYLIAFPSEDSALLMRIQKTELKQLCAASIFSGCIWGTQRCSLFDRCWGDRRDYKFWADPGLLGSPGSNSLAHEGFWRCFGTISSQSCLNILHGFQSANQPLDELGRFGSCRISASENVDGTNQCWKISLWSKLCHIFGTLNSNQEAMNVWMTCLQWWLQIYSSAGKLSFDNVSGLTARWGTIPTPCDLKGLNWLASIVRNVKFLQKYKERQHVDE